MSPIKVMLLGITIALLGLSLVESSVDGYLLKTFGFISLDVLTNIFPPISIGLVLVGVIVALVGLFLKGERRSTF